MTTGKPGMRTAIPMKGRVGKNLRERKLMGLPVTPSAVSYTHLDVYKRQHTIVIKRNAQNQYTYWDVHSDSVRGRSIMDLMLSLIHI